MREKGGGIGRRVVRERVYKVTQTKTSRQTTKYSQRGSINIRFPNGHANTPLSIQSDAL